MNSSHTNTKDAASSRAGLLAPEQEEQLRKVAQSRSETGQRAMRALMLLRLHGGKTQSEVAQWFEVAERTVRYLVHDFRERGLDALDLRPSPQRRGKLTPEEERELRDHWDEDPPRHAKEAREQVLERYGKEYTVRGMAKMLRRFGLRYQRPRQTPRVADPEGQREFVAEYERLRDGLPDDEAVFFFDAVHPEHQVRPASRWCPGSWKPAVRAASGRNRVNVLGSVDLATGDFRGEVVASNVNGSHVLAFLMELAMSRPHLRRIHVFLDNAGYNRSRIAGLAEAALGGRIKLHFLPPYAPHLNPIERLWGMMHKWVTHNRWHPSFATFRERIVQFLEEVTERWDELKSYVTDNFRIVTHEGLTFVDGSA